MDKRFISLLAATVLFAATQVLASDQDSVSLSELSAPDTFSLTELAPQASGSGGGAAASDQNWTVKGPVQMRAIDTEKVGTLDIRNIFKYSTTAMGRDDDVWYRADLRWGFLERHQLDLVMPINIGDGAYDGNYDLFVGWQWRLIDETATTPGFGIWNQVRLPTGYQSSGVDWEIKALITKEIVQDELRVHVNPFFRIFNGDNIESNLPQKVSFWNPDRSQRDYAAGGILGFDWRWTDKATVNFDYVLDTGVVDGYSMQHSMEAGIDYAIAPNQTLSWATNWTLDGDTQGDNWGFSLSYIFTLGVPAF